MPYLLRSATESAPHLTGSNRAAPIGNPALRLPPSTYSVHDNDPEPIPSDGNVHAGVGMTQCMAARRMHNALQPISRLNSDVLEQLFLTAALLAATHPIPPPSTSSSSSASSSSTSSASSSATSQYSSLTRTILTYAHLSSALRDTALRSKRVWALLLDFERGAAEWNKELLRRSGGVGLHLVWQWSKAAAGPRSLAPHARSVTQDSTGRSDPAEWAWEGPRDRVLAMRRAERGKRKRLEGVLARHVLERAKSLGFAVPAPYFASVLLQRLSAPGGVLPELESLRIVRSRPRRGSVVQDEDEDEDGDRDGEEEEADGDGEGVYVPLEVLANAPRLRRLAIAESNLAFHELLSSSSSISPSAPLLPPPSPFASALRTLANLQALHIADVPLRTAPTAREWLRYLTLMPTLETLVLEGAVVRRADRGLWDNLKAASGGAGGGPHSGPVSASRRGAVGHGEGDMRGMEDEVVEKSALPRLRLLTIDAALEDVAVFAATLPLPSTSHTPRGRRRRMRWTLLCADADTGDVDDVERVVSLLARAVRGDAQEDPSDGCAPAGEEEETAGVSLSVRAAARDVYVHLSASALPIAGGEVPATPRGDGADADGWDADPEAGFAIYVHLHSMGGGGGGGDGASPAALPQPNRTGVHDIAARPTIAPTSSTPILTPVLAALARAVLPQVSALEFESPSPNIHSTALSEVLRRGRAVEALTLGPRAAKGVLRMLHGDPHNRSRSMDSQVSGSVSAGLESGSESESLFASSATASTEETAKRMDADAVLLPSLRILHLGVESAAGPVWTALLRFVKARVARGVPVQRIIFEDKDTEDDRPQAHFVRLVRPGIPESRIRELEAMGVGVVVNRR